MCSFEPPQGLVSTQSWFASIITQTIGHGSELPAHTPSGGLLSEEAAGFITPSSKLPAERRIQIYYQQYWWRILSALQQNFPLLTRLFGYSDFNYSIAVPYLRAEPPQSWSIAHLGSQLSRWIDEYYTEKDKPLALFAAVLDWAYEELFFAEAPMLQEGTLDLSRRVNLQKQVRLFALPFDLFSFRKILLKEEVEFWQTHDFPSLIHEKKYFLLYRTSEQKILHLEIGEGQWRMLSLLKEGHTIEEACARLEKEGGKAFDEASSSLHLWIKSWIEGNFLLWHTAGTT